MIYVLFNVRDKKENLIKLLRFAFQIFILVFGRQASDVFLSSFPPQTHQCNKSRLCVKLYICPDR